ncbi:MAG: ABC transporter permease [Nitrosarchaeum sp.]|nr:ABC transporter permease [Nitrosarchaeum sp.]
MILTTLLVKNLRIVFRSWPSLFLLIIGPLALIILLGLAYSNLALHDIKIGIATQTTIEGELREALRETGSVMEFNSKEDCSERLIQQDLHACIFISRNEATGSLDVQLIYDNARQFISYRLIDVLRQHAGITSDKISLQTATELLQRIEETAVFMKSRQNETRELLVEAQKQRDNLVTLKEQITQIRVDFNLRHESLAEFQDLLNAQSTNTAQYIQEAQTSILRTITHLESLPPEAKTQDIQESIQLLKATRDDLTGTSKILNDLRNSLNLVLLDASFTEQYLERTSSQLDKGIEELDRQLVTLEAANNELGNHIRTMEQLLPEDANSLTQPITFSPQPYLQNLRNVEIIFPFVLIVIITFISVILANITMLNEIHSSAHFRNHITPVRSEYFILGIFFSGLIVTGLQAAILLIFAEFAYNIPVASNLVNIITISVLLIMIYSLVGIIIALFITSDQTSLLVCTFLLVSIFMLSDIVLPTEIMSPAMSNLVSHTPMNIGHSLLQQTLFYSIPLNQNIRQIMVLCAWIVALLTTSYMANYVNRTRL